MEGRAKAVASQAPRPLGTRMYGVLMGQLAAGEGSLARGTPTPERGSSTVKYTSGKRDDTWSNAGGRR